MLGESGPLSVSREALLNTKQTGPREWHFTTPSGPRVMVAFADVGEQLYSTYVQLG